MLLNMVFVLECNDDDKSDAIYLRHVLNSFYELKTVSNSPVSTKTLFMNGKRNYKSLRSRIANEKKMFAASGSQTVVIYIVDLDSDEPQLKKSSLNSDIKAFCESNEYEFVWMCKNVENVFLHKEPTSLDNKTEAAKTFVRTGIPAMHLHDLSAHEIKKNCSNLALVLDKYLIRKSDQ